MTMISNGLPEVLIEHHVIIFLWGHSKNKVYATPPINIDDLKILITAEVNILKENPGLHFSNRVEVSDFRHLDLRHF